MVMRVVAPTIITSGLSLYVIYVSMDRMKQFLNCVVMGAVCSLILNFLLMPHYGAMGAAISLLITEILVHVLLLYNLRNVYLLKWLFEYSIKITVVCLAIYVLVVVLFGSIQSVLEMFIVVLFYGSIYGLCFLFMRNKYLR